jgi:hypothetical protein
MVMFTVILVTAIRMIAQHDHPAPEKLGTVDFPTTCSPKVQAQFNRAVALLHSFAYSESEKGFQEVLALEPNCAMAHWGIAMSYYHQLWEPPLDDSYAKGAAELVQVSKSPPKSKRELQYVAALNTVYSNADQPSLRERMVIYERKMSEVAKANPHDTEAQVFYALALLSTAPPTIRPMPIRKKR